MKVAMIREEWEKLHKVPVHQVHEYTKPRVENVKGAKPVWVTRYTLFFEGGKKVEVEYNRDDPQPSIEQIVKDAKEKYDGRD